VVDRRGRHRRLRRARRRPDATRDEERRVPVNTEAPRRASSRRPVYIVAAAVCVLAIGALVFMGLRGNIIYYKTVSEAVAERSAQGANRFRLAGAVVPGSVEQTAKGVRFAVTDGSESVTVEHRGDPPDLFEARVPVLCEGRWGRGLTFTSDRILIKHGSEYRPPKVTTDGDDPERAGRPARTEYRPPKVTTDGDDPERAG
jgi:cytochrome c-type biogenesis protein CcmE